MNVSLDLRQAVAVGIDQLDRGEGTVFDDRVVERIKAAGREKLRQKRTMTGARAGSSSSPESRG